MVNTAKQKRQRFDTQSLADLVRPFENTVHSVVKTNRIRTRELHETFSGKDAVTALLEVGLVHSRKDAVALGRELAMHYNLFECVTIRGNDFQDKNLLYRFNHGTLLIKDMKRSGDDLDYYKPMGVGELLRPPSNEKFEFVDCGKDRFTPSPATKEKRRIGRRPVCAASKSSDGLEAMREKLEQHRKQVINRSASSEGAGGGARRAGSISKLDIEGGGGSSTMSLSDHALEILGTSRFASRRKDYPLTGVTVMKRHGDIVESIRQSADYSSDFIITADDGTSATLSKRSSDAAQALKPPGSPTTTAATAPISPESPAKTPEKRKKNGSGGRGKRDGFLKVQGFQSEESKSNSGRSLLLNRVFSTSNVYVRPPAGRGRLNSNES